MAELDLRASQGSLVCLRDLQEAARLVSALLIERSRREEQCYHLSE